MTSSGVPVSSHYHHRTTVGSFLPPSKQQCPQSQRGSFCCELWIISTTWEKQPFKIQFRKFIIYNGFLFSCRQKKKSELNGIGASAGKDTRLPLSVTHTHTHTPHHQHTLHKALLLLLSWRGLIRWKWQVSHHRCLSLIRFSLLSHVLKLSVSPTFMFPLIRPVSCFSFLKKSADRRSCKHRLRAVF